MPVELIIGMEPESYQSCMLNSITIVSSVSVCMKNGHFMDVFGHSSKHLGSGTSPGIS
jgi:hypothetical protein